MVSITVSKTTGMGTTVIMDEAYETPNDAVESAGRAGLNGLWFLNGRKLSSDDMDRPLSEFGLADGANATLTNVVKADSAA